jgi:adenine-specific DNA-methyltransferase
MSKSVEKVSTQSKDIFTQELAKFSQIFPQFVSEGKVDFDALKNFLASKDDLADEKDKYTFSWAGKDESFKAISRPSYATLNPKPDESIDFDNTENLFIEGDNLEVLKLLQNHYHGKIKMIYIDPPYNTGNDFIYKDNFKEGKSDYFERIGTTKDGIKLETNSDAHGRYHSQWLSMMYPRLFLAKQLLADDGVIFISIDDNEQHHLKMLMNEVFGEDSFEGHIHWRRRHNQPNDPNKLIAIVVEHIYVYSKNLVELKKSGVGKLELTGKFSNPDNDSRGDWNSKPWKVGSNQGGSKYTITIPSGNILNEEWMGEEKTYQQLLQDNRIYFSDNGKGLPRKKIFKEERELQGQSATNWFKHEIFGSNQDASTENV